MLRLNQVIIGNEPETVTFEVPLSYDALSSFGSLELYIDPSEDEDSDEGCLAGDFECKRATNGNCLLVWSTIYESPGKHALQAGVVPNKHPRLAEYLIGLPSPFIITNLCQFSLISVHFDPQYGVNLRVRLAELNGAYTVKLKSTSGQLLKTITGSTTNSDVKVHWNLTDEHGNTCTNEAFDTLFHITLPDSGRSQTLRGP